MLYEIIEKTNEWKLGDGFLKKAWMRQCVSAEEVQKVLDETRDLRGWEYNRGISGGCGNLHDNRCNSVREVQDR